MAKFADIKKPFLRQIPSTFKDASGKKLCVLERGERSYLIRNLDSTRWPYRVMERLVSSDAWGYQEMLIDRQKYQPFACLEDAEKHFKAFELGESRLMIGI